jgi:hypothetical protein
MAEELSSYTFDEANALIPSVRAILLQLAVEKQRFDTEVERLAALPADGSHEALVRQIGEGITALAAHLEQMGVQLRDVERGLVDIPTERDGEAVWFCWQLADAAISFWHTHREGFDSRRPW